MAVDSNQLISELSNPKYTGLSDADTAALASIPTGYSSFPGIVNRVTLGSTALGDSWGIEAAVALQSTLKKAAADNSLLDYFQSCLTIGIDPKDANGRKAVTGLVSAGIISQTQMDAIFGLPIYPAQDVVTEADVVATRAIITRRVAGQAWYTEQLNTRWNPWSAAVEAWMAAGFPDETKPKDLADFVAP